MLLRENKLSQLVSFTVLIAPPQLHACSHNLSSKFSLRMLRPPQLPSPQLKHCRSSCLQLVLLRPSLHTATQLTLKHQATKPGGCSLFAVACSTLPSSRVIAIGLVDSLSAAKLAKRQRSKQAVRVAGWAMWRGAMRLFLLVQRGQPRVVVEALVHLHVTLQSQLLVLNRRNTHKRSNDA